MPDSPQVRDEEWAWRLEARRRLRGRRLLLYPALAVGIVALVLGPPLSSASWAPVLRWSCQRSALVTNGTFYVPGVYANAPYGGIVWANGSEDPHWGIPAAGLVLTNGASGAVLFPLGLSLYRTHDVLLAGPGPSHRCLSRYMIVPRSAPPTGGTGVTVSLRAPGTMSDGGAPEPSVNATPGGLPVLFSVPRPASGFPVVATCGGPARDTYYASSSISLVVPFQVGGQNVLVSFTEPDRELFHYHFPSDFGTWTSGPATGASGGGYAFSWSACPPTD